MAIRNPCTDAREWGHPRHREIVLRGTVELVTFLAFDWFAESLPCWHAAAAIIAAPGRLKPVTAWSHNDEAAAMHTVMEVLGNAGEGARGRWARKTTDGIDLYRAPTEPEKQWAAEIILGKPELPPEFTVPAELEHERIDGDGNSATGTNGTRTTRTEKVRLFRVQSE